MESIRALPAVKIEIPAYRVGIAAVDAPADLAAFYIARTAIEIAQLGHSTSIYIGGRCTVAAATLTGRVALYDLPGGTSALGQPLAVSETITLTASGLKDATAGKFVAQRMFTNPGTAYQAIFLVDTLSGGVWDITLQGI